MRYVILLMIAFALTSGALYAQDDSEDESGTGPKQKPIGNFSVFIAEDADVSTNGKQVYIEDIYKYVGRKFKAVEARLKKIEEGQQDLKNKVKEIEDNLSKMKKAGTSPQ